MKQFKDTKEMYMKIVKLQEDSSDALQNYIKRENVNTENYIDKLYNSYNELAVIIFDELQNTSRNLEFLLDNTKTDGDIQLIAAFVRAYITDKILEEVVYYEELVDDNA